MLAPVGEMVALFPLHKVWLLMLSNETVGVGFTKTETVEELAALQLFELFPVKV